MKPLLALLALLTMLSSIAAQLPTPRRQYDVPFVALYAVQADVIVTGKVQSIDRAPVEVKASASSSDLHSLTIANVKVAEALVGAKGVTHVRVGFPTLAMPAQEISSIVYHWSLSADQEGAFMLQRHFSGEFYTLIECIPEFRLTDEVTMKSIRTLANIINEPAKAFDSDIPSENTLAAGFLVRRYSDTRGVQRTKRVDISAQASKRILQALLHADWRGGEVGPFTPFGAFMTLRADNHGFQAPPYKIESEQKLDETARQQAYLKRYEVAAKEWLRANTETFRIQKYE